MRYGRGALAEERRVIVVGSGPPGAAAALFPSRAGADVLVLEAGSQRNAFGLSVHVRGFTVLEYRRPLRQNEGFTASGDPGARLDEEIAAGVPCAAVVLAAGAIRTAEVLFSSTSADFPGGLGNTHGVLGHYFHDHPLAKIILEDDAPLPVHPAVYLTRPTLERAAPLYGPACVPWSGKGILARSGHPGRLRWTGFNASTMHASPRYGMLDGRGLRAVRNVVVAESTAFTTGPEKNPVLTAMTLSARAASMLGEDLRAGDL